LITVLPAPAYWFATAAMDGATSEPMPKPNLPSTEFAAPMKLFTPPTVALIRSLMAPIAALTAE